MTSIPFGEISRRVWNGLARHGATWLSKVRIWHLAVLYLALIAGMIVFVDTNERLGLLGRVWAIKYADKIAHFILYGMLSLLLNLAVFEARPLSNPIPRAIACSSILVVLVGLEEWSQTWLPSRSASLVDLTCSLIGVTVFAFLAVRAWNGRSASTWAPPD